MPSKPKTARREHSPETIAVILALDSIGYSIRQIRKENGLAKSTIHGIIRRAVRNPDAPYRKARRTGRPPKLDERAERRLIRFIGLNPFETIASYSTPSKSGYLMHLNTTRRYLKKNEIYAFRPRKKPYLSKAHKRFRLKWAKEHQFWEVEDWACVAWSDEATFEIGLDTTPP
jgi:transposase